GTGLGAGPAACRGGVSRAVVVPAPPAELRAAGQGAGPEPSPSPPPRAFLYQIKIECYFTNAPGGSGICTGTSTTGGGRALRQRPGGVYVADTELGRPAPRGWNKDPAILAQMRGEADRFCRHNYEAAQTGEEVGRTVQPKVKVSPMKSESQPHSHLLVCSVTGFYPSGIEIKWLKNGQEQTAGVVSTELLQNGDWTFQILVMLEMSPRRGDVYTCQVEHISLRGPLTVHWEAQSDSARSKMLTGVGGFVLGLIFLAPGLLIYLKNKKGERLRVGARH
uniref:Ig-like domain-containing protein n=1 Tax=Chelonoidis abingdonii TaxID=106734 RepID=A0A8C0G905_CHEAB